MIKVKYLKTCVLLTVAILMGVTHTTITSNSIPPLRFFTDSIEKKIPELMVKHHVPGVSIALIDNFKVAYKNEFGVRSAQSPESINEDTIMEACSMSKLLLAHSAMKLVEEGKFELDKPLTDYLGKDYEPLFGQPQHRLITARMVLSHTSGLPNWREGGREERTVRLRFKPGTSYQYSGEGFWFLQHVIEKITNESWEKYSKRTLLSPLGMKNSEFAWNDRFKNNFSRGHDAEGKIKEQRFMRDANAAFTLYTTPNDYALFMIEMMKPQRTAKFSLGQESLDMMFTPISNLQGGDEVRGLGWKIAKTVWGKRIWHDGTNSSGFCCHNEFYPQEGRGIIWMTNSRVGGREFRKEMKSYLREIGYGQESMKNRVNK